MKLEQLGDALSLPVHGNKDHSVLRLAPIERAGPDELAFVVSARYASTLESSGAGAVILPESMLSLAPNNALVSKNPYASYALASWILHPEVSDDAGIHPSAIVHADAQVSPGASVGAFTTIGPGACIGDAAVIGAHCSIGRGVTVGQRSRLFSRVVLYEGVVIGEDCRIQSGAVIGSEGFGYAWASDAWQAIHQVGGVRIGARVHIGANTTIDCGALEPTVIEDGVILDNQIQIAHNVHIGSNTAVAGCVGIAGSTRIGSHCQIGGACNIVGHLQIADEVIINAASLVTRSIKHKGRYGSGTPLLEQRAWRRGFVSLSKLDELFNRVRKLENQSNSASNSE